MKLVLHEESCPALSVCCGSRYRADPKRATSCDGERHVHTCHAPTGEQLEELRNAAEDVIVGVEVSDSGRRLPPSRDEINRLDAALRPFREKP